MSARQKYIDFQENEHDWYLKSVQFVESLSQEDFCSKALETAKQAGTYEGVEINEKFIETEDFEEFMSRVVIEKNLQLLIFEVKSSKGSWR